MVVLLMVLATWLAALGQEVAPSPPLPPIYAFRTEAKAVGLTFDDGPDPRTTPEVLALLRREGARATFFVIGEKARDHPEIVKAEVAAGMEVEDHSLRHVRLTHLAGARLAEDLSKSQRAIEDITGRRPTFLRPPYGVYSERVREIAARHGERLVLWSIDTRDWEGRSAAAIARHVLSHIRPGDIVLFHDGGKRSAALPALAIILPDLRARGFSAVTLKELEARSTGAYHTWPPRGTEALRRRTGPVSAAVGADPPAFAPRFRG